MFLSQTVTRSQSVPTCSFGLLIPNLKFLVPFWFISFLIIFLKESVKFLPVV